MSQCNCEKPFSLRISDEQYTLMDGESNKKFVIIRCCSCGGKWGDLNLTTNVITNFTKKRERRSRYISRSNRYVVLSRQRWSCNMCGCKLKYSNDNPYPGEVAHIDHIIPFSERKKYDGDINDSENLQALCPSCNLSKGKKKIH